MIRPSKFGRFVDARCRASARRDTRRPERITLPALYITSRRCDKGSSLRHDESRYINDRRLAGVGNTTFERRGRRRGLLRHVRGERRSRVQQYHQLHQRLLHPGRGLLQADGGAYISATLRLGADRHAQHRLRGRPDRQRARLHGGISESLDENRDQLLHRQPGGGRSTRSTDLLAAVGTLGRHGDLVPRFRALQDCTLPPGELYANSARSIPLRVYLTY